MHDKGSSSPAKKPLSPSTNGKTQEAAPSPESAPTNARDIKKANCEQIVSYIQKGIKPADQPGKLGLEVEHFVIRKSDSASLHYEPYDGDIGVKDVLSFLLDAYPDAIYGPDGELLGCSNESGSVTLEPGAQLEISLAPFTSIADISTAYGDFRKVIDPFLESHNLALASLGYRPRGKATDYPLIPWARYRFLDKLFSRENSLSIRMMRGSAATQISIDYTSETDAIRKLRVASALIPILAAITENLPVFEDEQNTMPLRRLALWRQMDSARTGVIEGIFDDTFSFERYAEWLLSLPPIVFKPPTNSESENENESKSLKAAREKQEYGLMNSDDVNRMLSMFWTDVRMKQFIEIRPADSLPLDEINGYAALIKGIFYSEENLHLLESELGVKDNHWPLTSHEVEQVIEKIRKDGMAASIYGATLSLWEERLFSMARAGLADDERAYLAKLEEFATKKPWA